MLIGCVERVFRECIESVAVCRERVGVEKVCVESVYCVKMLVE